MVYYMKQIARNSYCKIFIKKKIAFLIMNCMSASLCRTCRPRHLKSKL